MRLRDLIRKVDDKYTPKNRHFPINCPPLMTSEGEAWLTWRDSFLNVEERNEYLFLFILNAELRRQRLDWKHPDWQLYWSKQEELWHRMTQLNDAAEERAQQKPESWKPFLATYTPENETQPPPKEDWELFLECEQGTEWISEHLTDEENEELNKITIRLEEVNGVTWKDPTWESTVRERLVLLDRFKELMRKAEEKAKAESPEAYQAFRDQLIERKHAESL